ncbi:MAG: hypothetical protein ACJA1W_000281 [Akkermansiaceae bacterium]|jgi:hypothetical protein
MESNFAPRQPANPPTRQPANPPTPPPSSTQAIPLSSSEESPSPIPPRLLSESRTSPNSSPATSPKIPPSAASAKKTPASPRRQFQQRVPKSPDGPSSAQRAGSEGGGQRFAEGEPHQPVRITLSFRQLALLSYHMGRHSVLPHACITEAVGQVRKALQINVTFPPLTA